MIIVAIVNSLSNGGAEKFAVELSNGLSKSHQVYLFVKSPIFPDMLASKKLDDSVRIVDFDSSKKWDLFFALRLLLKLRKIKPDVLHIHSSLLLFYVFYFPFIFPNCRIFHTIHSQVTSAYIRSLKWVQRFTWGRRKIEHVVISSSIRNEYVSIFPELSFTVIENGVKQLALSKKGVEFDLDKRKRLLAIGNFTKVKRFDLLAEVLQMPEIRPFFRIQILGQENSDLKSVTRHIQSLNAENIELLGLKENVGDYLNSADALVIWSSVEGMPLVMLESLSMGCPVIASPVGGIPDVIKSGDCGILTRGLSQSDLKDALLFFKDIPKEERERMRERCVATYLANFSMSICVRKYNDLFLKGV
jgi:glycosyltransferase involved in cell wall biosynthesis